MGLKELLYKGLGTLSKCSVSISGHTDGKEPSDAGGRGEGNRETGTWALPSLSLKQFKDSVV